jgi:hypothetical protein
MNQSNQTGFFTKGVSADRYRLPHRSLGLPVILLIRRVICRAIGVLRERRFDFANQTEDRITVALHAILENDLRKSGEVAGFNRGTYESVVRHAQVANFDGTKLSKTPDLRFKLHYIEGDPDMALSDCDALFVECKPVDAAHPVGSKYLDDGLNRFIDGGYAWAMQEGMMLAFARDGRTIAKHLIPAMNEQSRVISLAIVQFPQQVVESSAQNSARAEPIHVSRHRRSFHWPDGKGQATNIAIYHLWHDCS